MRPLLLLLLSALAGCAPGYSLEGEAEARQGPFGKASKTAVTTNPTNLVLDATAHPSGNAAALKANSPGSAWGTVVTPSFSTGAGPNLFIAMVGCDGGSNPFAGSAAFTNTSGLTWTDRKNEKSTAGDYGTQLWSAYSAGGSLSSQTVTWTANSNTTGQNCSINVLVIDGVPGTEAGSIGASGGFIDNAGASTAIHATVNAAEAKDWIVVVCSNANSNAALTADSNTTPFDTHNETTSDAYVFGRYRSSGSVQATSGSGNVTVGATQSDLFASCAAIAVKSS